MFQGSVRIDIPVQIRSTDQSFAALIELRATDHLILFSGTQLVTVRGANSALPVPILTVDYAGPGRSAETVTLSPSDMTVVGVSTITYTVSVLDATGQMVSSVPLQWASSDTSIATIASMGSANANAQARGKRGVTTLSATTPLGVRGSVKLSGVPVATHLVLVGGEGQTGVAGSALAAPMVVEVQAADNLPVPGAVVNFRAMTPGGSVANASSVADTSGRAATKMLLGKGGGPYRFEASSGRTEPVVASASATPAPAAAITIVSGDGQVDSTSTRLVIPLVVRVTDQYGGPVDAQAVNWLKVTGSGLLGSASTTTTSDGTASNIYVLGSLPGGDVVSATVPGVGGASGAVQFSATTLQRGVATLSIARGGQQTAVVGTAVSVPPSVLVKDANGLPVPNAPVVFGVARGSGRATGLIATSNAAGIATLGSWTLDTIAGMNTLTATTGAVSAAITATGIAGAATQILVASAPTALTVGIIANFAFQVADAYGNPVARSGIPLIVSWWWLNGPRGSGGPATTNAQGIGTFFMSPSPAVPCTFVISAPGLTTNTFTLPAVAGAPAAIYFKASMYGTNLSGLPFAHQPVVQITDDGLNPVNAPGFIVSAVLDTSGGLSNGTLGGKTTVTSDATGAAAFTDLSITGAPGLYGVSFKVPGLRSPTPSGALLIDLAATTIAESAGNNQSAQAGSPVLVPPAVLVTDRNGAPRAGTIVSFTFTTADSGGRISNGFTTGSAVAVQTNASGIAQLTRWSLGFTAGVKSLSATPLNPLNGSPVTFTATAVPGPGVALRFITPPPPNATSSIPFGPQPAVQLTDAYDNAVKTAGVVISAAIASGAGVLSNSTAITNAVGVATFSSLTMTGTGSIILSFAGPGYSTLSSGTIVVH